MLIPGVVVAEVPHSIFEIETACFTNGDEIQLRFEISNVGDRTVWIVSDTEPWSPAFISNQFTAQVVEDPARLLRGPLAFGHSMMSVKVPAHGPAKGSVQLHAAFPEISQISSIHAVRLVCAGKGLQISLTSLKNFRLPRALRGV